MRARARRSGVISVTLAALVSSGCAQTVDPPVTTGGAGGFGASMGGTPVEAGGFMASSGGYVADRKSVV